MPQHDENIMLMIEAFETKKVEFDRLVVEKKSDQSTIGKEMVRLGQNLSHSLNKEMGRILMLHSEGKIENVTEATKELIDRFESGQNILKISSENRYRTDLKDLEQIVRNVPVNQQYTNSETFLWRLGVAALVAVVVGAAVVTCGSIFGFAALAGFAVGLYYVVLPAVMPSLITTFHVCADAFLVTLPQLFNSFGYLALNTFSALPLECQSKA